ncbi:MAG: hypothetical protein JWN48_5065 [Myxococcaceae bacterium]|nr:hypothetical protein [Myxococcaceae bacterium]
MLVDRVVWFGGRFASRFALGPAFGLTAGLLCSGLAPPSLASAQVTPPTSMQPVPLAPPPGPQPTALPIATPATPLVPIPETSGPGQPPAAPAPFPQGAPPAASAYPQPAPVYAPPYAPTQPPQPYYGQYATPPGYRQPQYSMRPLSRPAGPGSHEHEGFFLRLSAGGGAAGMTYKESFDGIHKSTVKTRGIAGSAEVAIGGRVVGNLIVHGNVGVVGVSSRRSIDGVRDDAYDSLTTQFWLLGAGATYYLMPTNLYFTLVFGTGGMVEHRDYGVAGRARESIDSGAGFASSLAIGKEWWVGGRGDWGIGASINGAFYVAPIEVGGVKSTATGNNLSICFSATLN